MAHNYFFHGMQYDKSKFISKRGRKCVTHNTCIIPKLGTVEPRYKEVGYNKTLL